MKRKTIIISILLIIVCAIFFFIRQHNRIENRVLKDVAFNYRLDDFVNNLYFKYKIPIVMEGSDYSLTDDTPLISYSAKKTTVRQLLDAIVPEKDFIWTTNGNVIHVISTELASRPNYQMNFVN